MTKSPAFTLLEILLVMTILAIILIPAYTHFSGARSNQALSGNAEELANVLRQAHVFARENRDEVAWGVKSVDDNQYELVNGDLISPTVKKSYPLDREVTVDLFTVWFDKGSGDLTSGSTADIILQNKFGNHFGVHISNTGIIDINAL